MSDVIKSLPDNIKNKVGGGYVCYILRSLKVPQNTYSGSTNDFVHRIRQHHGLISGGARSTQGNRPWIPACIVSGFSCRHAALRYEFYTKVRSSGTYKACKKKGLNSIERRAALLRTADLHMSARERTRLSYWFGDQYVKRCYEIAHVPGTIDSYFLDVDKKLDEACPVSGHGCTEQKEKDNVREHDDKTDRGDEHFRGGVKRKRKIKKANCIQKTRCLID